MQVVKRDGRTVEFDSQKIFAAIKKCYDNHTHTKAATSVIMDINTMVNQVVDQCHDQIGIEKIQDLVCIELEKYDPALRKAYANYRTERDRVRREKLNKELTGTIIELVEGKENEVSRENSNKDARMVYTQRDLIAGEASRYIYENSFMEPDVMEAHHNGEIHFHDIQYALQHITNCCLINLEDMFANGTVMNGKMIETPKSLRTAATLATQIIAAVGNSQYGGTTISISHLSPYVRVSYEKIKSKTQDYFFNAGIEYTEEQIENVVIATLKDEIRDAMQTFQYQVNTLVSTSGQAVFLSVYLDVLENPEYQKETAMLIEEILKQRMMGMKNDKGFVVTPAFPKLLYCLREENIRKDSQYYYLTKLSAECTAKRMNPDYISAKTMMKHRDNNVYPCMGCRSFLTLWKNKEDKYQFYGRFNLGVISLNLPYYALKAEGDETKFFELLDEYCELAYRGHMRRITRIGKSPVTIAPILWQHGALTRLPDDAVIDDAAKNGYATVSIGYAGMNEAVKALGVNFVSEEGHDLGIKIMKYLNKKCDEFKGRTGYDFSVYGTPMESTVQKFSNALKKFPIIEGVNDRDYITNSYHVPVYEEIDAFSKYKFEAEFQQYSIGGCISYIEAADLSKNIEAVETLINYIYNYMVYAEINTRNGDVCHECGYEGEIKNISSFTWECPNCGNRNRDKLTVVRRTCGYIGSSWWNFGREKEIHDRVVHL